MAFWENFAFVLPRKTIVNAYQIKYGPWALITGAARGIGKAFAKQIAHLGINVILVDILQDELDQIAQELGSFVQVKAIQVDLGDPVQVSRLIDACIPYEIGLFCCNHAATHLFPDGRLRLWADTDWTSLSAMLDVNLHTSLKLTYFFAQKMRILKRGGIILVSSGAALMGSPYLAQYSAIKAFLTNLGETLWWELKRDGIDVITVLPGATRTPGALRFMNELGQKKIALMSPEDVAQAALNSLGKKLSVIVGWKNRFQAFLTGYLLPRHWSISAFGAFFPRFFNVFSKSPEERSQDL